MLFGVFPATCEVLYGSPPAVGYLSRSLGGLIAERMTYLSCGTTIESSLFPDLVGQYSNISDLFLFSWDMICHVRILLWTTYTDIILYCSAHACVYDVEKTHERLNTINIHKSRWGKMTKSKISVLLKEPLPNYSWFRQFSIHLVVHGLIWDSCLLRFHLWMVWG